MAYKNPLCDKNFKLALSDVVYRFHICGQYGKNPEKAIKALMKRASGYAPEDYRILFYSNLKLLISIIDVQKKISLLDHKRLRKTIYQFYLR